MEEEYEITCPYCGEGISILVDVYIAQQSYIEDCSVCCKPIQVTLTCDDGAILSVDANQA